LRSDSNPGRAAEHPLRRRHNHGKGNQKRSRRNESGQFTLQSRQPIGIGSLDSQPLFRPIRCILDEERRAAGKLCEQEHRQAVAFNVSRTDSPANSFQGHNPSRGSG
jgi:hypothetical protein